jgi:hypothetical protein
MAETTISLVLPLNTSIHHGYPKDKRAISSFATPTKPQEIGRWWGKEVHHVTKPVVTSTVMPAENVPEHTWLGRESIICWERGRSTVSITRQ